MRLKVSENPKGVTLSVKLDIIVLIKVNEMKTQYVC